MTDDIKALIELEAAATKGPWKYQENSDAYTHILRSASAPGHYVVAFPQASKGKCEADARFVAAFRNSLPALLDTLTALQAENASLRLDAERYRWLRKHWGYLSETYDGYSERMVSIDLIQESFIEDGWPVAPDSLDECIDAALAQTDKEKL
jgi:hypothetical protein